MLVVVSGAVALVCLFFSLILFTIVGNIWIFSFFLSPVLFLSIPVLCIIVALFQVISCISYSSCGTFIEYKLSCVSNLDTQ